MNYSIDEKLRTGTNCYSLLAKSINIDPHFFLDNGYFEEKHDLSASKDKIKGHRSTNVPNLFTLIFSQLVSGLHCQMLLAASIRSKTFVKDIPHFNINKYLFSLFGNKSAMDQVGEGVVCPKLKEVLMSYILSQIDLKTNSAKHQCLNPIPGELSVGQEARDSPCSEKSSVLGGLLMEETSEGINEYSEGDEADAIFDCNEDFENFSSLYDEENDNEADDNYEADDDGNDDTDGDEDIDLSSWDESDKHYSSPTIVNESGPSVSFISVDQIMMKWDPGIDEELKNLPQNSISCESLLDSSEEDDKLLIEANQKWNKFYCFHYKRKVHSSKTKKVSFACEDELLRFHHWDDSEECRNGPWQQFALDAARFRRRIEECGKTLDRVLQPEHRNKMLSMVMKCGMVCI